MPKQLRHQGRTGTLTATICQKKEVDLLVIVVARTKEYAKQLAVEKKSILLAVFHVT